MTEPWGHEVSGKAQGSVRMYGVYGFHLRIWLRLRPSGWASVCL